VLPHAGGWGLATVLILSAAAVRTDGGNEKPQARRSVDAAITAAGSSIPDQAEALARLAWPATDGDPEVAELARVTLVDYQAYALPTIRAFVRRVRPDQQASVVTTLLAAYMKIGYGQNGDFLAGLNEAVWYGSREARLIAIPELGRFRVAPAMLTIIDAASEDPAVLPVSIEALARIADDRARFFLEQVMLVGDPEVRGPAASALARIGGDALLPLKVAVRSDDPSVRVMAVQALLPFVTVDDLSTLHDYIYAHPDDDPATVEAVRASTMMLEAVLTRQTEASPE
jgi:hypothetical protein